LEGLEIDYQLPVHSPDVVEGLTQSLYIRSRLFVLGQGRLESATHNFKIIAYRLKPILDF